MVVYLPLYDNADGQRDIWVRPLTMFDEVMTRDGKQFKRFCYVEE